MTDASPASRWMICARSMSRARRVADIKTWLEPPCRVRASLCTINRAFCGVSPPPARSLPRSRARCHREGSLRDRPVARHQDGGRFRSLCAGRRSIGPPSKGPGSQTCRDIKIHAYVAFWKGPGVTSVSCGILRCAKRTKSRTRRSRSARSHRQKEPIVEARALIGIQNEIGVLVQRGEARDLDETHRLVHLREQLRGYESGVVEETDGTGPQMQGGACFAFPGNCYGGLWRWAIKIRRGRPRLPGLWRLSEAEKTPLKMKVAAAEQNAREFAKERRLAQSICQKKADRRGSPRPNSRSPRRLKPGTATRRQRRQDRRRARNSKRHWRHWRCSSWSLRVDEPVTGVQHGATPPPADTSGMPP